MSTHEEMLGLSQEAWDRLNPRETSLLVLAEGESPVSIDIIFVHGMLGDRKSTWTKDNILWPRDLLPQQLKHARIMTWGYQSSSKSISNHGMQLLNDIGKPEDDPERPIILVGHSTGGLVVKEALLYGGITRNGAEMFLTPEEIHRGIPTLWTRIAGVIFMATPHHGITKTKLAKMIASITDTRMQATTAAAFASEYRELPTVCFCEEYPTNSRGLIVAQASAFMEGFNVNSMSNPDTHEGICKFSDANETGYRRISGELIYMMPKAPRTNTAA